MTDGNDNGTIDGDDLQIRIDHFGGANALSSFSETRIASLGETRQQVPEPFGHGTAAVVAHFKAIASRRASMRIDN